MASTGTRTKAHHHRRKNPRFFVLFEAEVLAALDPLPVELERLFLCFPLEPVPITLPDHTQGVSSYSEQLLVKS